jgi:Ser/Thr protein kinase RdoA (MazF antagonist)
VQPLASLLAQRWGVVDAQLTRAERGHTNETFFVRAGARDLVLRISFAEKPAAQIAREQTLLDGLARVAPELPVPRLLRTVDGAQHAAADARVAHLWERLPGAALEGPPSPVQARAALATLAELHRALARLPGGDGGDPVEWLRARWARVRARGAGALPPAVAAALPRAAPRVDETLEAAVRRADGAPLQWLHGDYHVGNLLFTRGGADDRVSGVVDFDDVGRGAPSLERGLARWALARDVGVEERLRCRDELRDAVAPPPELERLFCVDQVLIHLEAAQRGLWALGPGIGFWPCWTVLVSGD